MEPCDEGFYCLAFLCMQLYLLSCSFRDTIMPACHIEQNSVLTKDASHLLLHRHSPLCKWDCSIRGSPLAGCAKSRSREGRHCRLWIGIRQHHSVVFGAHVCLHIPTFLSLPAMPPNLLSISCAAAVCTKA